MKPPPSLLLHHVWHMPILPVAPHGDIERLLPIAALKRASSLQRPKRYHAMQEPTTWVSQEVSKRLVVSKWVIIVITPIYPNHLLTSWHIQVVCWFSNNYPFTQHGTQRGRTSQNCPHVDVVTDFFSKLKNLKLCFK